MTDAPEFERCPATRRQEQIWLAEQLAPGSAQHHLSLTATIRGPLDIEALRRSLRTVVNRHAILRTTFRREAGALVQEVRSGGAQFAIHDLEETDPAERTQRLADIAAEQLGRPFDLENDPPVRTSLVILDLDEYQLFVVTHRIVADEASLAIFGQELLDCYDSFAKRRRPALPEPPFSFAEHTRRQAQAREQAGDLGHWRAALADLPGPLELPFARARGSEVAVDAGTVNFRLPEQVAAGLRKLAETEGTSPRVLLLAAATVLLHRYTHSRDIVLGTWADRRSESGAAAVIGPFAEPSVVRTRLPHDPTWREALKAVQDAAEQAAAHQEVSFAEIVSMTRPERHLNLHPVFQVLVAPVPDAGPAREVAGSTFELAVSDGGQAPYDLELRATEDGGYLRYRTDLFSAADAGTIAGHLTGLLEQMLDEQDTHLSNLSLLSASERQQIVRDWNETTTDFPRDRPIQSLFEAWADHTPSAPALRWDNFAITYRELEIRANRLAHYLRSLGVGPETSVGLYFGYTAEWVIGALATLKAGGLYVPLEPSYPTERLMAMCEDADVRVMLTLSSMADGLPYAEAKRVCVDLEATTIAGQPVSRPEVPVDPDQLAYIMFTSGSTGRAKAIGVTHRNVIRTVCNTPYVDFRPTDTVGQGSNISFDAATWEVWGALLNGSRLVGFRKDEMLDPVRLQAKLVAQGLTVFFMPAALMKQIVSEKPDTFGSLRYFFSGGEQADLHTIRRLLRHGAPEHLVNPYGPTETTVFAIVYRCNDMPDTETHVPIGYPIGNTTAYILDPYLQPVPVGVVGELFVGGDGVARGYVGQPDLTADKFIADPFSDEPGARLYRSGDLARYRPDGMIDFLGRMDRQVKVRGFRIEPDEIEACLLASGLLREASVQVDMDRSGDQTLVAYVVPAVADLDTEELLAFVRSRLPVYMMPGMVIPMTAMPLNPNGKLDVVALRRSLPTAGGPADAPPTTTEQLLVDVWRDALRLDGLGVRDDVFAAGADSLTAGRVVSRLRDELDAEIPFRLPFEHRTIAAQAAAVDLLRPAAAAADTERQPLDAATRDGAAASADITGQVLAIWREVLEAPTLGLDDDFFLNGGHSLKVTRVVSRIKATLHRDVPVTLLFENRTVRSYSAAIEALGTDGADQGTGPALSRTTEGSDSIDSLLDQIEKLGDDDIDRLLSAGD